MHSGSMSKATQPAPNKARSKKTDPASGSAVDKVDSTYLQSLMGYNARRAALSIIGLFLERLAPYGLKPVDFSVMSIICHNAGTDVQRPRECGGIHRRYCCIQMVSDRQVHRAGYINSFE